VLILQADAGKTISHGQVREKMDKWLRWTDKMPANVRDGYAAQD